MSRFSRAFLREKLGGRVCVAAFGKHPAWDDHIGLLGAQTETLALLEDILYRQGIAGQVAAGRWRDSRGEVKGAVFNHRFVWSRGDQSVVGALWSSIDGKGRGEFPFVCCVQIGMRGTAAVQTCLDFAAGLGNQAREASTQSELHSLLERAGPDFNRYKPVDAAAEPLEGLAEKANMARDALASLARWATMPQPAFPSFAAGHRDASVRLPALNDVPAVRLWFYAGFLEQFSPAPPIYLLITNADPAGPVDCVLGEPGPDAFFCLGADMAALPVAVPPRGDALPERLHPKIESFLAACAAGALPEPARRRFWQRFR